MGTRSETRIRPVRVEDAAELHRLAVANRAHLAPTSPTRPEHWYSREGQRSAIAEQVAGMAAGTGAWYVVVLGERVVGRVTLSGLARGPFQSADLGYWVDRDHTGQGIATDAVGLLVAVARDELGLHRVAAGTLPDNGASQQVLLRNGFEQYGLAPGYLLIRGRWRDHALFQRLLHD